MCQTVPAKVILTLLLFGASCHPASAQQESPMQVVESPPAPSTREPLIELKQSVNDVSATDFRRRVSELLGVDVRDPRLRGQYSLPAGKWQPDQLLDLVSEQIKERVQLDGAWQRTFIFATPSKAQPSPISKLRSAGKVSIERDHAPFSQLASAIAKQVGAKVELPENVVGAFHLAVTNAPVEDALADLAAQAGMTFSVAVAYVEQRADPADAPPPMTEEERNNELAVLEGSQEAFFEATLVGALTEVTGVSPLDPEFNWDAVDSRVWAGLGLGPADVVYFRMRMDERIANEQAVEVMSAKVLFGGGLESGDGEGDGEGGSGGTP